MKFRTPCHLLTTIMFVICCLAINSGADQRNIINKKVHIITKGPRALRDAITLLSKKLNCVITYEDPAFRYPATTMQLFPGGPIVPRSQVLSYSYDEVDVQDKGLIIRNMIAEYQKQPGAAKFRVVEFPEARDFFHIVPISSQDEEGKFSPQTSLLDKGISMTASGTYLEIATKIIRAVNEMDRQSAIAIVSMPAQAFRTNKITVNANNDSALSVLTKLIADYNTKEDAKVSWSISRDPSNVAFLSFYTVMPFRNTNESIHLNIEGFRPLAEALRILENNTITPIFYEDPPYLCSCEVMKDKTGQAQTLSGGTFTFSYSAEAPPDVIAKACVEAYAEQSPARRFDLRQATHGVDKILFVVPLLMRNESAEWRPIPRPILETPISLTVKNQSLGEVLKVLVTALAEKANQKIELATVPESLATLPPISYQSDNKSAAVCFIELSRISNRTLSFQLLFDPRSRAYTLNVIEVRPEIQP